MPGARKKISPSTEAALWGLSNGYCYAPGCRSPVVVEVRPGVYRKNAQVAHIRGVRAPRYDESLSPGQCAAFGNLLLLCLAHHGEVDDRVTGEALYPVRVLQRWKSGHEGADGPTLAALGPVSEESLTALLLKVFSPPARRLQQIADQLEKTGTLNAGTVEQLRQVVRVLAAAPARTDRDAAELLAQAARVFAGRRFHDAVEELASAAGTMSATAMDDRISPPARGRRHTRQRRPPHPAPHPGAVTADKPRAGRARHRIPADRDMSPPVPAAHPVRAKSSAVQ